MASTDKALPDKTTIWRVLAQTKAEAHAFLNSERGLAWIGIDVPDVTRDKLQDLLLRWYMKGITAGGKRD